MDGARGRDVLWRDGADDRGGSADRGKGLGGRVGVVTEIAVREVVVIVVVVVVGALISVFGVVLAFSFCFAGAVVRCCFWWCCWCLRLRWFRLPLLSP